MKSTLKKPVEYVEIDENSAGQRIDNFLFNRLKGVPKGHTYRILRKGEVRVNKGRIKPTYRLQVGDTIRIPPMVLDIVDTKPGSKTLARQLQEAILYEDSNLLIINKPSGLAVHGGTGLEHNLIDTLQKFDQNYQNIELVHRLDKDTSGCLVLAKNKQSLRRLHDYLRDNEIKKTYLALVAGHLENKTHTITAPLLADVLKGGERLVEVSELGKKAETVVSLLDYQKNTSLVSVVINTGRKHQIRVHMNHIGHPIAGDVKYGDKVFNQSMRAVGLKRLFLHASRVCFKLDKQIDVSAPLSSELDAVIKHPDL